MLLFINRQVSAAVLRKTEMIKKTKKKPDKIQLETVSVYIERCYSIKAGFSPFMLANPIKHGHRSPKVDKRLHGDSDRIQRMSCELIGFQFCGEVTD